MIEWYAKVFIEYSMPKKEMKKQIGKVVPVQKIWLSSREARSFLDCSENFLQKLRDEAQISFSVVGRKYYYDLRSLERLIVKNRVI